MTKASEKGEQRASAGAASVRGNGGRDASRGEKRAPTSKRAKPPPKGVSGVPGSKYDSRRCTATANRTGERCKAPAIKGGNVCRMHGGALPQVKKSAKERLLELADPALAALSKIVRDEDTDDAVRLRAALGIMDRIGLGPGQKIEVGVSKFDELLADLAGGIDLIRDLPGSEHPALGGGGGHSWEDVEQHATDAQAEAWREYDQEDDEAAVRGRIQPDENTVPGEVVGESSLIPPTPVPNNPSEYTGGECPGRYDRQPDLGPTDPPRYWDEEARRADG